MNKYLSILMIVCISAFELKAAFLENQKAQALRENKLILLSVTKDHCPYCLQMEQDVFNVPHFMKAIQKHYIRIEIKKDDPSLPVSLHVKYYPTNLVLNPRDLTCIDEFIGYTKPDIFMELLEEVYAQGVISSSNTSPQSKK